jgi:hypothetical protein
MFRRLKWAEPVKAWQQRRPSMNFALKTLGFVRPCKASTHAAFMTIPNVACCVAMNACENGNRMKNHATRPNAQWLSQNMPCIEH